MGQLASLERVRDMHRGNFVSLVVIVRNDARRAMESKDESCERDKPVFRFTV